MGNHKPILRCSLCGKEFTPGNRLDGIPNGVGFQREDGSVLVVCAECLIEMGKERESHEPDQDM